MEITANSEYTRCGHKDFEECFDEKGRCRDCRHEDEVDRPCPYCSGVGCEGFCPESGRCDCNICYADGTSMKRIPVGSRRCHEPAPA